MNCRLSLSLLVLATLSAAAGAEPPVKGVTVVAGADVLGTRSAPEQRAERQEAVYFESAAPAASDRFRLTATERSELRQQIEEAAAEVYGGKRLPRRAEVEARP